MKLPIKPTLNKEIIIILIISTNAERKAQKYRDLVLQQSHKYANVKFINLSMSALGIFDKGTSDFLDMLTDLHFDTATKNYIVKLKSHWARRGAARHDADLIWFESHD